MLASSKFDLPDSTAITLNPIYWRMFGYSYSSEETTNLAKPASEPLEFDRLQGFCTMIELRECCSMRCQIVRQSLERVLPPCDMWPKFRRWVLVAESCQMSVSASKFVWLDEFTLEPIISFFDEFWRKKHSFEMEELAFDISEIFWFHRTQIEPRLRIRQDDYLDPRFSTFRPRILQETLKFDQRIFYKASQQALTGAAALNICRKRLWDLVFNSRRSHADVPSILRLIKSSSDPSAFAHKGHRDCTPEFCESTNENTTTKLQLHKCSTRSCGFVEFPVSEVTKFILDSEHIVWSLVESPEGEIKVKLSSVTMNNQDSDDEYSSGILAISHVWSDGTGAGVERLAMVNICLVKFFLQLAKRLDCSQIWWDTVCVPMADTDEEKKARSIAISKMHGNFANAKHVVIHDEYLLQVPWEEDGAPAVALVLSPWFSRGWTALELSVSRSVKVLYRNPRDDSSYVVKDLYKDVLALGTFRSLGQAAASFVIERLLGRPKTLLDLITILSTRSTAWPRDRMAIAALLARIENFDYSSSRALITPKLLAHYGTLRKTLLHHEQAPLVDQGPYAWCPSNLFLSPPELLKHWDPNARDDTADAQLCLESDNLGSILGFWECTVPDKSMVHRIKPVATHLHVYRVLDNLAANELIILHSEAAQLPDLLVTPTGQWRSELDDLSYVQCHYIGCVRVTLDDDYTAEHMQRKRLNGLYRISVGSQTGQRIYRAGPLLDMARDDRIKYIGDAEPGAWRD